MEILKFNTEKYENCNYCRRQVPLMSPCDGLSLPGVHCATPSYGPTPLPPRPAPLPGRALLCTYSWGISNANYSGCLTVKVLATVT